MQLTRNRQSKSKSRNLSKRLNLCGTKCQQGVAIVVALFIVALVTAMSYAMLSRLTRDTRRTALIAHDIQADLYAQGSVIWAKDILRTNVENKKPDRLVDATPIKSPVNTEQGYHISSVIYDMQGRFNLNTMDRGETQAQFIRLAHLVMPKISTTPLLEIAGTISDWINSKTRSSEMAQYYVTLPIPYRPAHRPMVSVSELRLVKGVTPEIYAALLPYVTALPPTALINVQTAEAPILASFDPALTLENGKAIEAIRRQKPFTSTDAFTNLPLVAKSQIKAKGITVTSDYFLVETTVTMENQRLVLYTLLERSQKDNKPVVNTIWQSKGSW
jgi:general secretion pathway protein K